jgi:glucose-6-phosphate 1-dehydrogenase
MSTAPHDPALFVIFGGTGDLATRKLFPALAQSAVEGLLHEQTQLVGVGRASKPDEAFRDDIRKALAAARFTPDQSRKVLARLHYQQIGDSRAEDFRALGSRLQSLCEQHQVPPNYAFYLSLPPQVMPATVSGFGEAGLNQRQAGWTRVVLEKPFGSDLASAAELNRMVHRYFTEEQIYRIDHYLGKETVQNLLVFRLANGLMESAWNRERIESVQIMVGETLGIGSRGGYYDRSGALRDMVQNHLAQLLTLVAMEVPSSIDAEAIRYEKLKVLRSIAPIDPGRVVRGQYTEGICGGERCRGYLEEANVPADSQTETFVALELFVDTWRWKGVPFYLRTGKRMPKQMTQIAVRFREAPVSYFRKLGSNAAAANVLIITLQPNEGFSLHFDIKVPGDPFRLERIPLRFRYDDRYPNMPDAYQTLLLDVLHGDQTLFVYSDEVELSWKLFMPLIDQPPRIVPYAAGTWGPPEADKLSISDARLWQMEQ